MEQTLSPCWYQGRGGEQKPRNQMHTKASVCGKPVLVPVCPTLISPAAFQLGKAEVSGSDGFEKY